MSLWDETNGTVSPDRPGTTTTPPHAFHQNLPPHHIDHDGIPYVTKFAARKAQAVVDLVFSIQLHPTLLSGVDTDNAESKTEDDEPMEDPLEQDEAELASANERSGFETTLASSSTQPRDTLVTFLKKLSRLQAQLSTLEHLKYGGIAQRTWCDMVLHLLRLVTATLSYDETRTTTNDTIPSSTNVYRRGPPTLHWENVGYVYTVGSVAEKPALSPTAQALEDELVREFALPSPARELLWSVLVHILSNKGPLRSVSNASVYVEPESNGTVRNEDSNSSKTKQSRSLLILHWQVLLKTLLRTAPYLDEHKSSDVQLDSSSRHNTIVKRTVQTIRDARHFFDQGIRPDANTAATTELDVTAHAVWNMVRTDVLFHSHTHACYRGTILLYLFLPSRCSPEFYIQILPSWMEAWSNIDRCPEFDFLWLALFCRARKHVSPDQYDWTALRSRVLTHASYWLQLPVGGVGDNNSKSFPRAPNPRSRSCPPRLKVFAGVSSSYEEGIDFVAKIAKLLVASLGRGDVATTHWDSGNGPGTSMGTNDMLRFLSFVTPYFNPSNLGSWTFTLGAFLHYFAYELCCRVGAQAGTDVLLRDHPALASALTRAKPGANAGPIPPHELVAILHASMPLCQQALYSKNGHVGRAGEAAMLYLVQIDPVHTTPALMDFAARALDIAAVNLAHQAPSALSALTRLLQPSLRADPTILLSRLPTLLSLTLAGIDSNDQNKTIRTLILYRALASWVPVGGKPESWPKICAASEPLVDDGTVKIGHKLMEALAARRQSPEYERAIAGLSDLSLLKQGISTTPIRSPEMEQLLLEEATSAMSDWVLEFLDRVYGLLRASGEREKAGKTASGVASRHSSADVLQARNFSRVLKETLVQVFASMDDVTHALAVRSVTRFLEEETLASAAKDASLLCQAVAAARTNKKGDYVSPGLDALMIVLTDDLKHHSTQTLVYRLRCLAGAVRLAAGAVVKHRDAITNVLDFCLSSDNRHLFKTGCKLLRHTLTTLSESYAIASDMRPRAFYHVESYVPALGRSAELQGDGILWHVPDKECIEMAWMLLNKHMVQRLDILYGSETEGRSNLLNSSDTQDLRRCLRIVRYCIRGGSSLLLDRLDEGALEQKDSVPYEMSIYRLLEGVKSETKDSLLTIRGRLCCFLTILSSVIASETLHPDAVNDLNDEETYRRTLPTISADPKICKETGDISLLLLTRRGAAFRSQEARTIWKAQKQLGTDFGLSALVDHVGEGLQCADMFSSSTSVQYKDGEDAGKTVPRRLLVTRVQLFHDSLQRNASFEVPRSLRRLECDLNSPKTTLFSVKTSLMDMAEYLESLLVSKTTRPLDAYEGIVDGLFALCCHANARVRASAISVIDYAMTRFGWLVASRIPRLLSAISLKDETMNGTFGIPSCAALLSNVNFQGKRKRLADSIKGVCSILSQQRAMKFALGTQKMRFQFAQAVLGADSLVAAMPTEEMQKVVLYLQSVFSPFRSRFYWLPHMSPVDQEYHQATLRYVLEILRENATEKEDSKDEDSSTERGAVHWRKLLMACWFLEAFVDIDDMRVEDLSSQIWNACFRILESEAGQPLQRVALGLFGKLVTFAKCEGNTSVLQEKMKNKRFCIVFGNALVFDHKEDTSVGGGHDAQWSAGVEDIIRDSARHVAPRTLFPFQRTSQSMGAFKVSHSQVVELVLSCLPRAEAEAASRHLLSFSQDIASALPSEDQRNQQITSAEIFSGVCGWFLRACRGEPSSLWESLFLPHLEDVMAKIPFSLSGAYFDAIRYALQFCSPSSFYPFTSWLVERVGSTLWQPSSDDEGYTEMASAEAGPAVPGNGTEGFTAQSKWLYLFSAVLIEMDETISHELPSGVGTMLYTPSLIEKSSLLLAPDVTRVDLDDSWQLVTSVLLQRLTDALGHPFDSCRDHIARCLFRICYCHRKRARVSASRGPSRNNSAMQLNLIAESTSDPGSMIVAKLESLGRGQEWKFVDRYNALSTTRRFISYCVHLGEAKFEYSDYVIPLLPVAFEALKSTVEVEINGNDASSPEENTAKRALEAEVTKAFRYSIAEMSITAVISYGSQNDIQRVLKIVENASSHATWQVRHASANFLRCFQGSHKFLFSSENSLQAMSIVAALLADDRREVSAAAIAALTGILSALPDDEINAMVNKYAKLATKSKMKRTKKDTNNMEEDDESDLCWAKEQKRIRNQQSSVFFLCAAVNSQPYETPSYVPVALAAISKHSFERNAPLGVRDAVKRCCADYKKTHMSDNWELHRKVFTQEQLESLEDVVSSPHYYA